MMWGLEIHKVASLWLPIASFQNDFRGLGIFLLFSQNQQPFILISTFLALRKSSWLPNIRWHYYHKRRFHL
jgi:hypothetical protein